MSRPCIPLEVSEGRRVSWSEGISGRKWPCWSAGVGRGGSRVRPEDVECQFLGGNAKPGNAGSSGVGRPTARSVLGRESTGQTLGCVRPHQSVAQNELFFISVEGTFIWR